MNIKPGKQKVDLKELVSSRLSEYDKTKAYECIKTFTDTRSGSI